MKLSPEFQAAKPPSLPVLNLPKDKWDTASSLEHNLSDVCYFADCVAASIALYQTCKKDYAKTRLVFGADSLFRKWMFTAGRDTAMNLRNLAVALSAVRGLIGMIPEWKDNIDSKALKKAQQDFEKKFPLAHKMRHSVAHPELINNPNEPAEYRGAFESPGFINKSESGSLRMRGNISNDTFMETFENQIVSFPLSDETASLAINISRRAVSAFASLDRFSAKHEPPPPQDQNSPKS